MILWKVLLAALALTLSAQASVIPAQPILPGSSQRIIAVKGETLTTYTYRPSCNAPSLLVVVHGKHRNAPGYRDYARKLADTHCMMVVSPLLDIARLPRWRFGLGGWRKTASSSPLSAGPVMSY